MEDVVTLTLNPTIDKSASIDHVVPERKMRCHSPRFEPGGGGINVARALKKLGSTPVAWYLAGGPPGQTLRQLLEREHIEQRPFPIREWTRENFTVLEEATTMQYRFGMPGPEVQEAEWRQVLEALQAIDPTPDYLVASGSVPPGVPDDIYAQVARICQDRNIRLIADTSGAALKALVREAVYLIKPNIGELAALEGRDIEGQSHLEETTAKLVGDGCCEAVVVSLGDRGALLSTAEEQVHLPAPIVPVESKVGAGDSMVAGITHALVQGRSLREAACFGVAAGAAAVMTPGTELCRREDTERLYQQLREGQATTAS